MLQFDFPWAFALLPLPALVYWLTPEFRDRGEALRAPFFARLVEITGRQPQSGAVVLQKNWIQRTNGLLTWLLVVVALARPVWAGEPIVQEKAARDMMLIVDLSGSMDEQDFANASGEKITRLDAVKLVLRDFIARRKGDRLGLAVFGDAAFPQATFTEDHPTILQLLEELQTGMAGPKTVIGDAIGLAIRLFDASSTQNKVVILLTDGNDTGSQMPVARAASIAAEEGITIHTIAMGDPTTVGEQELDLETLQTISKTTGGGFFLALDRGELEKIYAELDKLEPVKLDTLSYRPKRPLFHYPLAALVVCNMLLAGVMLTGARRREGAHA
ncbi:MAG: VWA domain-containing protein [Hyphomicrobiaceae bacterium]|nr:VWA domain-containing protein [Hyphomicrobiaceae bacterium]